MFSLEKLVKKKMIHEMSSGMKLNLVNSPVAN